MTYRWVVFALVLVVGTTVAQQKIGHFNSKAVLQQLPEAIDAQKALDQLVSDWQQQLASMQEEWKRKFEDYDRKKLIMTDQRRAETEKELRELDQKIMAFRNLKFGQNGELFQKQNDLMKPVQDRIFKAVQDVAREEGLDYVFDKSGEILLMYSNEKYDVTQKVIDRVKEGIPAAPTTPSTSSPTQRN